MLDQPYVAVRLFFWSVGNAFVKKLLYWFPGWFLYCLDHLYTHTHHIFTTSKWLINSHYSGDWTRNGVNPFYGELCCSAFDRKTLSCTLSPLKYFLKQSATKRTAYTKAKEYSSWGYKHSEGLWLRFQQVQMRKCCWACTGSMQILFPANLSTFTISTLLFLWCISSKSLRHCKCWSETYASTYKFLVLCKISAVKLKCHGLCWPWIALGSQFQK